MRRARRIWGMVLMLIFLIGIYLLLPAPEIAAARMWIEGLLSRLK